MVNFAMAIKGAPVTKKNSQRIIRNGARWRVLPSKQFLNYQELAGYYICHKNAQLDMPLQITARYYMPTRRLVDIANLLEATDDILVHYGVIKDDNSRIVASHDGSRVYYDRDNPRVEIEIKELCE